MSYCLWEREIMDHHLEGCRDAALRQCSDASSRHRVIHVTSAVIVSLDHVGGRAHKATTRNRDRGFEGRVRRMTCNSKRRNHRKGKQLGGQPGHPTPRIYACTYVILCMVISSFRDLDSLHCCCDAAAGPGALSVSAAASSTFTHSTTPPTSP
jgi:hypothetical protein